MVIAILLRLNQFSKILKLFKSIVDNLLTCIPKLQSQLRSKNPDSSVTWRDLEELLNSFALPFLTENGKRALTIYFENVHSSLEEKRKKELVEKMKRNEITCEEMLELKNLLEKRRREKEEKGDLIGALLLGLGILSLTLALAGKMREGKKERYS
ncbi:MAG: hypothetical protein GXO26_09120 [Crenarchaeota archaeon]|nr:hypothetical protein [Thermoproteota archaeon]